MQVTDVWAPPHPAGGNRCFDLGSVAGVDHYFWIVKNRS
jgi:hypothetical protein